MKDYKQKRKWNIIIAAVTAIVWMGFTGSASAQFYPIVVTYPDITNPQFYIGDDFPIQWDNGAPAVDIALFKGGSYFTTIAENVSASNSTENTYYWTNVYAQPDDDYQVLVADANAVPPYDTYSSDMSPEFTFYCDCPEDGNIGQ